MDEDLFSFKANVLRIIRVARLLRMVKPLKGLRKLLKALWIALQNIGNVSLVLLLMLYIFAVSAMDLFGEISDGQSQINSEANFKSFYMAASTLFRSATGESWNYIMHDCYYEVGTVAIFYWILEQLTFKYIFFNIFIAVVFESLEDVNDSENQISVIPVRKENIKQFVNVWSIFCPLKEQYMTVNMFCSFIQELPSPLGFQGRSFDQKQLRDAIADYKIRVHFRNKNGYVYFPEVLFIVVHQALNCNDQKVLNSKIIQKLISNYKKIFKDLDEFTGIYQLTGKKISKYEVTIHHYLSAQKIARKWIQLRKDPLRREVFMKLKQINKVEENKPIFNTVEGNDSHNDTPQFSQYELDQIVLQHQSSSKKYQQFYSLLDNQDIRINKNQKRRFQLIQQEQDLMDELIKQSNFSSLNNSYNGKDFQKHNMQKEQQIKIEEELMKGLQYLKIKYQYKSKAQKMNASTLDIQPQNMISNDFEIQETNNKSFSQVRNPYFSPTKLMKEYSMIRKKRILKQEEKENINRIKQIDENNNKNRSHRRQIFKKQQQRYTLDFNI